MFLGGVFMDNKNLLDGIKKAKLKKFTYPWQQYFKNKTLIVGELFGDYTLLGIVDDKDCFKILCKYVYENDRETFNELGYDSLEAWIEEVELGNEGFGFKKDELEILED